MQISSPSTVSIAAAPASAGAVSHLLGKQGELASSVMFAPVDEVSLSAGTETDDLYRPAQRKVVKQGEQAAAGTDGQQTSADGQTADEATALSESELNLLEKLKQRDQEVKAHEQAHASVGGQYAGSASFTYQTGPDGVRYAIGGEVSVDLSAVKDDPQATIDKMTQVQQAALAPAEPSPQDRKVASQAGQIAASALADLTAKQRDARAQEAQRLEAKKADLEAEMKAAEKDQKEADDKAKQEEAVSAAEQFAEYNAKLRQINEVLLRISLPAPVDAGQLLDDMA